MNHNEKCFQIRATKTIGVNGPLHWQGVPRTPACSDSGRSRLPSKTVGTSRYHKYLYTRRKLSVSSVERSPSVVANSVDEEVTCVFNFSRTNFNWTKIKWWCALVARSTSHSWERAVSFKNINLPESLLHVHSSILGQHAWRVAADTNRNNDAGFLLSS